MTSERTDTVHGLTIPEQHGSDQHDTDQHDTDQHDTDQHDTDQHGTDQTGTDQTGAARDETARDDTAREDTAREPVGGQGTRPAHDTAGAGSASTGDERGERLVPPDRAASYGSRWDSVKGMFVDEPREAVAQADALVGELLDELEKLFREQRRSIEHGLDTDETSTEDLRVALRRYRSFFDRLLTL